MKRMFPRSIAVIVLAPLFAAACASGGGAASPAAFPGASSAPRPTSMPMLVAPLLADLIQTALGFRGVPYRLGGDSPTAGFDCSGFVQYVFSLNHIPLPRTVLEQSAIGRRIRPRDVQAGDLLFFAVDSRSVSHVGLATGAAEFIHAPAENGVVRTENVESPYWKGRFLEARRVIPGM
jgi:cell wall-associated NlpC family hydrolase